MGNDSKLMSIGLGAILTLVFLGFLASVLSPSVSFTDTMVGEPCVAAGCFYYGANDTCQASATNGSDCDNTPTDYAGDAFFKRSGAAYIILLAGAILGLVAFFVNKRR